MQPDQVEARARQATQRGEQARSLLEHPLMREALDALDRQLMDAIHATELGDRDGRERLYLTVWCKRQLEAYLERVIQGGELGKREIARIRRHKDAPKSRRRDRFQVVNK